MTLKVYRFALSLCLLSSVFIMTAAAQDRRASAPHATARPASSLQELVDKAAETALTRFANRKLKEENLSITLINLRDPQHPVQASFRGQERIYPASVVKLFYLAAAHRWLEDGKLKDSDELQRALRDMIVESSNDAAHYILDSLTDTTSGPELPPTAMQEWAMKRNAVNRYFASLGYKNINLNQKPWCEGPYGRDRLFIGANYENRNKLTTDATARLLAEIVTGKAVTPARSAEMMALLKRDFSGKSVDPEDQAHGFTGIALSPGMRLWSKAGWTSNTRHDAAYVELPDGARFVLVTFTTDHANEREIIPTITRVVIAGLNSIK